MDTVLWLLGVCGLLGGGIWWVAAGAVYNTTYPVQWGKVVRWFLLGVLCFAASFVSVNELQKIQRRQTGEALVIECPCGCGCHKEGE
jgi:hypothetical protein